MIRFGIRYDRRRTTGDVGYKPRVDAGIYRKVWNNGYTEYNTIYPQDATIFDGERSLCLDQLHPGPPYKEGGPFSLYRTFVPGRTILGSGSYLSDKVYPYGNYGPTAPWYYWSYQGGFYPQNWPWDVSSGPIDMWTMTNAGDSGWMSWGYGDPSSLGPTAWNRFKPKLSTADLGVFFGEIREVPRMLWTSARIFKDLWRSVGGNLTGHTMARTAADHWLNTQFGWRPFIGDLQKGFKTFLNADSALKRYREQNGTWIKRSGKVVSEPLSRATIVEKSGSQDTLFGPNFMPNSLLMLGAQTRISRETSREVWFEGLFRYYIPSLAVDDVSQLSTMQNYLRLYGIRINPMLVWNLTPWSWLVDWVSNVGDNISNFTDSYSSNMAAKYAYIMQTTVNNFVNETTLNMYRVGEVKMTWKAGGITKLRRAASPFGFSIDWPNFSARQWSILAALGISRVRIENSQNL